jgi:multiple sugar transport system substrate-binding protein
MKRRLHASLGLLLLALLVAPSCRSPGSGLTVIRFWALGAEGEHIRQMVPEFRRRYPGLDVEVQAIPWTAAHEKLLTAFAGNSLPDLFQLGNTWIPEFQVLGALEDLRPRLRASAVIRDSSYFPGIWATNVVDGTLLGIPWYVDTRVLFYRMDLFRQAGFAHPPATWQEWKRLSRALKRLANARGKKAYALLLPTNEWAPPVILGLQCGSSLLKDQNTEGDFSGASFRRAFEFYASFFREQLAPVGITQVTNIYQGIA